MKNDHIVESLDVYERAHRSQLHQVFNEVLDAEGRGKIKQRGFGELGESWKAGNAGETRSYQLG